MIATTAPTSPPGMRCSIVGADGSIRPAPGLAGLAAGLGTGDGFSWVDIVDPTEAQMQTIQAEFDLHPLAIDDACDAHPRGKIDPYENFWFIVAHAFTPSSDDEMTTTEVAIFAGERFVITVRHTPALDTSEIARRWTTLHSLRRDSGAFVYTLLDLIVDDYLPFVTHSESRLEDIEAQLLERSRNPWHADDFLPQILEFKASLQTMRHVVAPMQDVIARISRGDIAIFGEDEMIYYRNIGTHVKRVLARIDGLNEMVTTALSLNVSIASNRQAEISRQLTVMATIFLPLTFITGFFGQNFGWMVERITTLRSFLIWGVGLDVVVVVLLFWFFVRRRWL